MFTRYPIAVRWLFSKAEFRGNTSEKSVYLTFDDGPIPEVTPWVLDILADAGVTATFFCIGDNIRKHPGIFERIKREGHAIGNHTFHHLSAWKTSTQSYLSDVEKCQNLIKENDLFRPPYGKLGIRTYQRLRSKYRIILWDVLTQDYDTTLLPEYCSNIVKQHTRNGSIIVFHDSIKAFPRLEKALPESVKWLKEEGYSFRKII